MRLIDADELKKMFMYAEDAEYSKWTLNGVISEIDDMPTVDVLEQIRSEQKALITINSTPDYSNGVINCLNIIDNYR